MRFETLSRTVVLLLSLLAAAVASAAEPAAPLTPIPLERFFQQPAVLEAKLSPSGRRLAITTARGAKRVGLVVITLGAELTARGVTNYDNADVVNFDWVGDDRLVYSLVDLQVGGGDWRQRHPGLFAVDADGSHLITLIRRFHTRAIDEAMQTTVTLNASHELLQVPTPQAGARADEVVIGAWGFNGGHFTGYQPLWLNVRSGSTRPMLLPGGPGTAYHWVFDSKGEARAAVTRWEGRSALHWRGPGETTWRVLAKYAVLAAPFEPVAVTDDGSFYITHAVGPRGEEVLTRFDFTTLAPAVQPVLSTPGFDFRGGLVRGEPGAPPLGVRVDTDAASTVWFDEGMKRFQAKVDARLPGRINRIDCRRCGQADAVSLVHSSSDQDPGRLLLYEAAQQRWQTLTSVLDGIEPRRMAAVDFQRIKARDGHDLPVWLTLPTGVPAGQAAPAVVLVHGGPWVRGGHWQWSAMEQFLGSRGYLVISPEFRGSTGYGDEHFRAGWKQWGQAMQDDVADALLWAQAQGLASKRACIMGASYGGYATLMGLVRQPELYRCGVAWAAVTDPFLFVKGERWVSDDISSWGRDYELRTLVGDPEKDAAMLTAVSPLAQAARIRAPLLLAFGEKDQRVPLAHGERLRDALKAAGRPPEWVSYPEEGHGWREPATQIDFARRVEAFLARNLGPAAAP